MCVILYRTIRYEVTNLILLKCKFLSTAILKMPEHNLCFGIFAFLNVNKREQTFQSAPIETESPECENMVVYEYNANSHEDLK